MFVNELLIEIGQWFRPYQYQSALAIIATLLVLFGNDINQAIKTMVKRQHFVVRSSVFFLVCAFGYGVLTVWLTSFLSKALSNIPDVYIFPCIIGVFIALGMFAQKQRHI